jgi:hypothetical protein
MEIEEMSEASELIMGTAATEAIRISETFLPRASRKRQQELALEIADAISLCEAELTDKITKGLTALINRIYP